METVKTFTLKFEWTCGSMWLVTSDEIKGVVVAGHTWQETMRSLSTILPDLVQANNQTLPCIRPAVELDLLYTVAVELDEEAVTKPSSQAEVIRDAAAEIARLRAIKNAP